MGSDSVVTFRRTSSGPSPELVTTYVVQYTVQICLESLSRGVARVTPRMMNNLSIFINLTQNRTVETKVMVKD